MKRIQILLTLIVLFVVTSLLLFTEAGNRFIFSTNAPKAIKLLVQTIHPPKNLYAFLVKEDLDITKSGTVEKFALINKYVGRYDVGILLSKFSENLYFVPVAERYKLKLKMQVNFYANSILIGSYTVDKNYDPFILRNEGGFSFVRYKSPDNLPINSVIICEVKVLEPDKYLNDAFGPAKFFIKKLSDE